MTNKNVRQLADLILGPQSGTPMQMVWGVVQATHVGPPKTVDITLLGSTVVVTGVRYAGSYTPTVNDVVYGRKVGTDVLVEGKLA